ncbi:MAG: DMT family transporter [candidate division KSB1 bacterium]|nr:DMT family transporter [candidate division KSB1 bacterium]MDZ7367455.1 DMT family transporter [candidate division KSB1 bacterium]MDZ7405440.1 DMT family transporter [candidate division KSB1 bacterium]
MPQRRRAIIFLVIASLLWSLGGLLIKLVNWNALAVAGMRSAIATLVLLIYLGRPRFHWSTAQIGGAVAYTFTVILFVLANKLTTAANAILLQYSAPVYVALFGAKFLGEKTRWFDWVTVVIVLGGMALFFADDLAAGNWLGNICAMLSAVSFSWLVLLLRKQKAGSPFESIVLGNLFAGLIGLPFMFESMPDAKSWLGLILLGVFQLGLSYIFYAAAVKHVSALEAVLIPVLEPLLNPIWVLLLIGETPGWWAGVGGTLVLLAVTGRGILQYKVNLAATSLPSHNSSSSPAPASH